MALDILPAMASSVSSEHLFSSSGHTADDQQSRLGSEHFKQVKVMKWHWKEDAVDFAWANQNSVEEVDISEFVTFLKNDEEEAELDRLCTASAVVSSWLLVSMWMNLVILNLLSFLDNYYNNGCKLTNK